MKQSLNLSIDEDLIQHAKAEAERRGTSVSQMVEAFFASLRSSPSDSNVPEDYVPSERIRSLRSSLRSPVGTRPDSPAWDEERLIEEIQRKHS